MLNFNAVRKHVLHACAVNLKKTNSPRDLCTERALKAQQAHRCNMTKAVECVSRHRGLKTTSACYAALLSGVTTAATAKAVTLISAEMLRGEQSSGQQGSVARNPE